MGAYDEPTKECPYCKNDMYADFVDVGVGMVQCGPYHCNNCNASEIGPELHDWYYKDREGETIYLTAKTKYYEWAKKKMKFIGGPVLKPGHPFTETELKTGYYQGKISPYANTVAGHLVDHKEAKEAYRIGLLDEKKGVS
ncbi:MULTISPECIES: hypothetical protein [unclassified Niallia]|uniref:hypothetical protein n=1 Tax=unclassified Niallia TaxID=2837522 RepID=UPI00203B895D|nr:hypothetical protein [Niallia sp. MER 6]MCM3030351.1 hypothetical protein [Niallia sp. MER 6]